MSTATKRDGAQTRGRIEREALRLFAARGVNATSIRDIAAAVGVSEPALYRHFKSKDDIARSVFTQHYADLARRVRAITAMPKNFAEKITALVQLFCQLFDEEPDVFAFILLNQHEHIRLIPDDEEANLVTAIRHIMADAHAANHTPIKDADLATAMALGAVVQAGIFKLYGRLPKQMQDYQQEISSGVLHLLG